MRGLLVYVLVFALLFAPFVFAEKGGNPRNESKVPPGLEKGDKETGKPEITQPGMRGNMSKEEKKLVVEKIKNETAEKKQMLELRLQNISNRDKQKIFRNQNKVREAVMTLLALRDVTNMSGIGKNVSEIARGFNNSVQKTIQAEEAIQNRGGVMRFLFGGDEKAAATIQAELNKNRVMLQKLEGVKADYELEFQGLIEEQMQLINQEQERLMELAEKERGDKGLLGWLFK